MAAGVLLGALTTALFAALLWPSPTSLSGTGAEAQPPPVPPAPELPLTSSGSAIVTEDSDDEITGDQPHESDASEQTDSDEQEELEEPSGAPLLADAAPAGEGPLPDASPVTCPAATTSVSTADELVTALAQAAPGDAILLADGVYTGRFVATRSGTQQEAIYLCGSKEAVLDGGDPEEDGYTLHLDGATHWRLVGFSVTGGQKGVMADGTVGSVIQGLTVSDVGDEAIHLRSFSTDNVVRDNRISDTGQREADYGEGIYIGSAVSNWCTYTDCRADRSDRNVVVANHITQTTSEAIDVKEGTTGGVLADNVFDGSSMTEADTWVNLKGNNYLVVGNRGTSASENGFETHDILPGWGDFNVFDANTGDVGGTGWGIASWPEGSNVVTCSNALRDAAEGVSNIPCS